MSLFGTLPNFDHRQNDWAIFIHQLESFFIANDIDETKADKKKAILITSLSQESHKLLKSLIHPGDINSATYDQLTEALSKHFTPVSSCFVERFKFYTARKDRQETIQQWAVRLRSLAANCDFGSCLPMVLRDKFIMSLPKGSIRDRLFMEDATTLTFDEAVEIAASGESLKSQPSNQQQNWTNPKAKGTAFQGNQNKFQQVRNPRQDTQEKQYNTPSTMPTYQQQHVHQNQRNPNSVAYVQRKHPGNARKNENADQCNIC